MAKLNLDENEIKRLYVEEKKMIKEIAEIMNCDRNVITRRLQQEVDLLINWMKEKWNIDCSKQKNLSNFVIYLKESTRLDFERLIFPYMIPSMYYKLKFLDILKAESVG